MSFTLRIAAALLAGALSAGGALAQAPLKIFDAHLHYNQEPNPFYDLDKVLETFRRNNIATEAASAVNNTVPGSGTAWK